MVQECRGCIGRSTSFRFGRRVSSIVVIIFVIVFFGNFKNIPQGLLRMLFQWIEGTNISFFILGPGWQIDGRGFAAN